MSAAEVWLALAGMTLVTLATRAFFLFGSKPAELPARLQRALRYAPAAALAAVVVPDVTSSGGVLTVALSNHPLYASLLGLIWYLWRRSMIETIVVGMAAFNLLRLVF